VIRPKAIFNCSVVRGKGYFHGLPGQLEFGCWPQLGTCTQNVELSQTVSATCQAHRHDRGDWSVLGYIVHVGKK
jgi:hypothetical protein